MAFTTPEQAHTALIEAIEYELDTYGPASLADVIVSLISNRYDADAPKLDDPHWRTAEREYEKLAELLNRLPLRGNRAR